MDAVENGVKALKPGLKPLPRFRLKAGLRQGVAGAPGLVSKVDAEVGVPASAGRKRRPSGLADGRKTGLINHRHRLATFARLKHRIFVQ